MAANITILTDTEAETSIENNDEKMLRIHDIAVTTTNITKSLFNITLEDITADDQQQESLELKELESRLDREIKDWRKIYGDAFKDLKKSEEKLPPIDISILAPEKRAYLENAPCLQSFIRDSLEFRQEATIFLEKDHEDVMDMVKNLKVFCLHRLKLAQFQAITQNLANFEIN